MKKILFGLWLLPLFINFSLAHDCSNLDALGNAIGKRLENLAYDSQLLSIRSKNISSDYEAYLILQEYDRIEQEKAEIDSDAAYYQKELDRCNDKIAGYNEYLDLAEEAEMDLANLGKYDEDLTNKAIKYYKKALDIVDEAILPNASSKRTNIKRYISNLEGYKSEQEKRIKAETEAKQTQSTNNTQNSKNSSTEKTLNDYKSKSDELKDAIQWMYDNGLTIYNTLPEFLPYDDITREQASKFFVEFAANVLGKDRGIIYNYDIFSDIKNANPTLKDYIIYANNMGLFQGSNGKFKPFNKLTKAQAIAVAIRMVDGYLDESGTKPYDVARGLGYSWYSEYAGRANYSYNFNKRGSYSNFATLDSQYITRGDMAIILYDMYMFRQNKCFYGEIIYTDGSPYCERLGAGWEVMPGF